MTNPKSRQAGFTILEILIAVIIIAVLVAVAVSRFTQRTDDARYNTARSEMLQMAKAEQAIELDTGYYVMLRLLNDTPGNQGNSSLGWYEYSIGLDDGRAIDTSGLFASKNNVDLQGDWRGPYMQFKQKGAQSNMLGVDTSDVYPEGGFGEISRYGIPLDPWGNAYRLYGPNQTLPYNYGSINPDLAITDNRFVFDRFTLVSFGKNTTRDFDKGAVGYTGDDIIVPF
ncbi:MAG: prepilin-type N-terminal cleavage/methylation domain-containing protein [bacterium]